MLTGVAHEDDPEKVLAAYEQVRPYLSIIVIRNTCLHLGRRHSKKSTVEDRVRFNIIFLSVATVYE